MSCENALPYRQQTCRWKSRRGWWDTETRTQSHRRKESLADGCHASECLLPLWEDCSSTSPPRCLPLLREWWVMGIAHWSQSSSSPHNQAPLQGNLLPNRIPKQLLLLASLHLLLLRATPLLGRMIWSATSFASLVAPWSWSFAIGAAWSWSLDSPLLPSNELSFYFSFLALCGYGANLKWNLAGFSTEFRVLQLRKCDHLLLKLWILLVQGMG